MEPLELSKVHGVNVEKLRDKLIELGLTGAEESLVNGYSLKGRTSDGTGEFELIIKPLSKETQE